jgi:hypothetical protein
VCEPPSLHTPSSHSSSVVALSRQKSLCAHPAPTRTTWGSGTSLCVHCDASGRVCATPRRLVVLFALRCSTSLLAMASLFAGHKLFVRPADSQPTALPLTVLCVRPPFASSASSTARPRRSIRPCWALRRRLACTFRRTGWLHFAPPPLASHLPVCLSVCLSVCRRRRRWQVPAVSRVHAGARRCLQGHDRGWPRV